jgi:hypothetical protein
MVLVPMKRVHENCSQSAGPTPRSEHIWLRYFQGVTTKYTAVKKEFV